MKSLFAYHRRTLVIVLAALVLALLVGFSIARAQSGGITGGVVSFQENNSAVASTVVPGGPGYISLNGLDFKPFTPTNNAFSYIGTSLKNTGASADYFIATVQIPNGSTIKKVVTYYTDEDANVGMDLEVQLIYVPLGNPFGINMTMFHSSGSAPGLLINENTTITNPVVDRASNTYIIQVILPNSSNVSLLGVRIDYAYLAVLPVVMK